MRSRNKNFIILPKSGSGHGRTDRTGSAGHEIVRSVCASDSFATYGATQMCFD